MRPTYLLDVPFVPSSDIVFDVIGRIKNFKPSVLIDMGAGDGKILKYFKNTYQCEIIGYEKDKSRAEILSQTIGGKIYHADFWEADVSKADVIYLYWMPHLMQGFLDVFWDKLLVGCYVISNQFELPGKTPILSEHGIFIYKKEDR